MCEPENIQAALRQMRKLGYELETGAQRDRSRGFGSESEYDRVNDRLLAVEQLFEILHPELKSKINEEVRKGYESGGH